MDELHILPREFEDTDKLALAAVCILFLVPFMLLGFGLGKLIEWITYKQGYFCLYKMSLKQCLTTQMFLYLKSKSMASGKNTKKRQGFSMRALIVRGRI